MKKNLLSASLCVLVCVGILSASPRGLSTVTLVAGDDGNVRVGVAASCVSTSWTVVVASRATRRLVRIKAQEATGGVACLGTDDSGSGVACTASTLGTELGTGDEYADSNEAALYCRTSAGSGTVVVKGFDMYDSRD